MIKAEVIFVHFSVEEPNGKLLKDFMFFDSIQEARDFVAVHNFHKEPVDHVDYVKAYYNGCIDVDDGEENA